MTYKAESNFWPMVIWPAVAYVVLTEVVNIIFRSRDYFTVIVRPHLKSSIINELFNKLINHSYSYFQDAQVGSLVNKIIDLSKGIEFILDFVTEVILWRSFSIIIAALWLSATSPKLTFIVLIWAVIFVSVSYRLSKLSHLSAITFAQTRGRLFGYVIDSLSNILSIKTLNGSNHELNSLNQYLKKHEDDERQMLWSMFKISLCQGTAVSIFIGCITWVLLYSMSLNEITTGDFAFVMIIAGTIVRNVYSISTDLVKFSAEIGNYSAALQSIDIPQEITEVKDAKELIISNGNIELSNVSFEYKSGRPIFKRKNLLINGGSKIGIVGMSGGGKSTLAHLLLRLFDTQLGDISIDGQLLRELNLNSLRENITLIPQEPTLFNRSIFDNICYGTRNATIDDVKRAAQFADCDEFISELSLKYDTIVGERGVKLSVGQRQRIVLARAFLRNSKILILDEPTSALDSLTECKIQSSLFNLMQDKTCIVIAHRLSTLQQMDQIIVFDKGNIVEEGSHQQLLSINGLYKTMWYSQVRGFGFNN